MRRWIPAIGSLLVLSIASRAGADPDPRPKTLPYEEGAPPPSGYHYEERARVGLIVSGGILTGLGVVIPLGILYGSKRGSESDRRTYAGLAALLLDGPGIPLLVVGLSSRKKVWARDVVVAWKAGPLLCGPPTSCAGFAIGGTF